MLAQEERKQMILRLFVALKESSIFPGYNHMQIKEAAIRAEQRIYEESNSREEYLQGMNERFKRIQNAVGGRGGMFSMKDESGLSAECRPQNRTPQGQESARFQTESNCSKYKGFHDYATNMQPQNVNEQEYLGNRHANYAQQGMATKFKVNKFQSESMTKQNASTVPKDETSTRRNGFREINNSTLFYGEMDRDIGEGMSPNIIQGPHNTKPNYSMNVDRDFVGKSTYFENDHGFERFNDIKLSRGIVDPMRENNREAHISDQIQAQEAEKRFFGYQQNVDSQPYGHTQHNRAIRTQYDGMYNRYSDGMVGRSKSEHFLNSPINMNQNMQRGITPGGVHDVGSFLPPRYNNQFYDVGRMPRSPHENSRSSFSHPGENGYGRVGPGFFIPDGHKYPVNPQKFVNSSIQEPISFSSTANARNPSTSPFAMNTSHPFHRRNAEWNGFERPNNQDNRMQGGRPAPIFFNQQVQHQPFSDIPLHIGTDTNNQRTNPFPGRPSPSQSFQSTFSTAADDASSVGTFNFTGAFDESPRYFNVPNGYSNDEFNRVAEDYPQRAHQAPWSCLSSASSNIHMPVWFNDRDQCDGMESVDCSVQRNNIDVAVKPFNQDADGEMNNVELNNDHSARRQKYYYYGDKTNDVNVGATKKQTSTPIPAEVEVFLRENRKEKVYLNDSETLNLDRKLREGIEIINKSLKIYNIFKETFPASELTRRYDTIRNLIEKQNEYFKYGAYFLKACSVDNFVDQVKSLTVDMSYELRLNATSNGDVNHGECLRSAVRAFVEKKKKCSNFCLNITNRDKT